MALEFHYHPLSSYCWKALVALYENGTAFTPKLLNLMDEGEAAAFRKLWPLGKMPVLDDKARGEVVAETSIVIEYLDDHYPGPVRFIPAEREAARAVRFWDRIFDLYVHIPMQKVIFDRLRPEDQRDPSGVEHAKAQIQTAYGLIDAHMSGRTWAAGDAFSLADCAACPALYYGDKVSPIGDHAHVAAYLERLKARPSFARVLTEAEPYFAMFPSD